MDSIAAKWDRIYTTQLENATDFQCAEVLQWYQHLLPASGVALDLACGLGANSIVLAQSGLQVHSWDASSVAINHLKQLANQQQLNIYPAQRDVVMQPPEAESVDVLVVTHFLERDMVPQLVAALKPGGLMFYQTYCQNKLTDVGPSNPAYLLKRNELLQLFSGLTICAYREDDQQGNLQQGWRNQALLVGQKN